MATPNYYNHPPTGGPHRFGGGGQGRGGGFRGGSWFGGDGTPPYQGPSHPAPGGGWFNGSGAPVYLPPPQPAPSPTGGVGSCTARPDPSNQVAIMVPRP